MVHILCGRSSTDVLRYCGTDYLCLSGYWCTEVKGVTVVHTLCGCLSTGVLRQ